MKYVNGSFVGCKTCADYGVEGGSVVESQGSMGQGSVSPNATCKCVGGQYLNGTKCAALPACPAVPSAGRNYTTNFCTCGINPESTGGVLYSGNDYVDTYAALGSNETVPLGVDPVTGPLTNCTRLSACPSNSRRFTKGGPCQCNDAGFAPTYSSNDLLSVCTLCTTLGYAGGVAVSNTGFNSTEGQCRCHPRDMYNATSRKCVYSCPSNSSVTGTGFDGVTPSCACDAGLVTVYRTFYTGSSGGLIDQCQTCAQAAGLIGGVFDKSRGRCQCPSGTFVEVITNTTSRCKALSALNSTETAPACPSGTTRSATTSRCECNEPTVAWTPVPALGASQPTPAGWTSNSTRPVCIPRCGAGTFYSLALARCVCLPGTAPRDRTSTGVILTCSVVPQVSAAGPPAALLPADVTATLITAPGMTERLSYAVLEGASFSITLSASADSPIGAGEQVVVTLALVGVNGTFDASRFLISPAFVTLTNASSEASVTVTAVDDFLVNGNAVAMVRASVDTLLTTATEYVRAPVAVTIPVVAVNNDVAALVVTSLRKLITDVDVSEEDESVFNVRLTANPGAGVSVTLALDGTVSADVFVPVLMQAPGTAAFLPPALTSANWQAGLNFMVRTTAATPSSSSRGVVVLRIRTVSTASVFNGRSGNTTVSFFRWSTVRPTVFAPASIAEGSTGTVRVSLPFSIPDERSLILFATLDAAFAPHSVLSLGDKERSTSGFTSATVFFSSEFDASTTTNKTLFVTYDQDTYPTARETTRVCFNNSYFPVIPVVCTPYIRLVDDDKPGIAQPVFRTLVDGVWATRNRDGALRLREGALTTITVSLLSEVKGRVSFVAVENRTVPGSSLQRAPLVKVETSIAEVTPTSPNATLLVSGLRDAVLQDSTDESRRGVLVLSAYATVLAGATVSDAAYQTPVTFSIPFVLVDANDGANGTVVPALSVGPRNVVMDEGASTTLNVTLSPTPAAGKSVRVTLSAPEGVTLTPSSFTFNGPEAGVVPSALVRAVTVSVADDRVVNDAVYRVDVTAAVAAEGTDTISFLATTAGSVRVTIRDNDVPALVLSRTSASVTEDTASEAHVAVSLSVAPPIGQTVVVSLASAQGMCTNAAGTELPRTSTVCFTDEQCTTAELPKCVVLPVNTKAYATVVDDDVSGAASGSAAAVTELRFTSVDWNVPTNITIKAHMDSVFEDAAVKILRDDGQATVVNRATHPGLIRIRIETGPSAFLTTKPASIAVAIMDVDVPNFAFVAAEGAMLMESPSGTPLAGRFVLTSRPLVPVTIRGVPATGSGLSLAPTQAFLTPESWSTGFALTLRIADDKVARGDPAREYMYEVPLALSLTSIDPAYNFTFSPRIEVVDDDRVGVTVTPLTFATSINAAARVVLREGVAVPVPQFSVSLTARPSANVTVSFDEVAALGEALTFTDACLTLPATGSQLLLAASSTTSAATLTFTPTNWQTVQFASFVARADSRKEGTATVSLNLKATSTDAAYAALKLTGQSVQVSDEMLADPPTLPIARFSDDYSLITLAFAEAFSARLPEGRAWTQDDLSNCTNWLSVVRAATTVPSTRTCLRTAPNDEIASTVAMLGEGAMCQPFRRPFTIVLGARATIITTDKIVLLSGRFTSASTNVQQLRTTSGTVALADARTPLTPSVLVNNGRNVSLIGSCDTVTVSANPSGTAGRPFTVTWTATEYKLNGVAGSPLAALTSTLATSASGVVLTTGRFPPGAQVTLAVTVTNFMGKATSGFVTVTRSDAPKPMLSLPSAVTVVRSSGIKLEVSARLPSCDDATNATGPALSFYWYAISDDGAATLPSLYSAAVASVGESFSPPGALPLRFSGRRVDISGLDLAPRTYKLHVFAVPSSNRANFASTDVDVVVSADPLVAVIEGGDERLLRAGSALTLDASNSGEPTAEMRAVQTGVTYSWACTTAAGACGITVSATSRVEIDGAALQAGTTYAFTVNVSAPLRPTVSATQRVTISSLATPTLFGPSFTDPSAFVNGFLPNVQTSVSVSAELEGFPNQAFTYTWYTTEGSLPTAVLESGTRGLLTLPPSAVSPDTKYTLCVTAESVTPVASRGIACASFATAPAPSVAGLSASTIEGTANEWKVGLEFAKAVDSIYYTYMTSDAVSEALTVLRTAGVVTGPSSLETGVAYARFAGVQGALNSLVYKGGAGDTTFVTSLLPSGPLVLCAFGVSVTGLSSQTCVGVTVPEVILSVADADKLLLSGARSGDSTEAMGTVAYVVNTFDAVNTTGRPGRRLAAGVMSSSTLKSTLTAAQSALDAVLAGTGSDLGSFASTLSNLASTVQSVGDASDKTAAVTMALSTLQAMVSRKVTITGAAVNALVSTLVSVGGMSQTQLVETLARELQSAGNSYTFSNTESGMLTAGSSGLTRDVVSAGSMQVLTAPVDPRSASRAVSNPVVIVSAGGGITTPLSGSAAVKNVTLPIEVQVAGMPLRAAGDRSPFVSIRVPASAMTLSSSISSVLSKLEAVYAGADGKAKHDGVVLSYDATTATVTLFATHNSTFVVAEGAGSAIIISATGSGTSTTAATIQEGSASTFYVRLPSQPDATVSVALSMPSGVCVQSSGSMEVANGVAVTCSADASCGAGSTCKAQLATFVPSTLTFTPTDWASNKAVTVSATVDGVYEPEAPVVGRMTLVPSSSDSRYDSTGVCTDAECTSSVGNAGATLDITITDVNTPAVTVSPLSSTTIREDSTSSVTYTVVLASKPFTDVSVSTSTASSSVVDVSPSAVTFTSDTWAVPQTVTVSPKDDSTVGGDKTVTLVHSIVSSDVYYGAVTAPSRVLTVTDNDVAGVVVSVATPSSIAEDGSGSSTTITITLSAKPASSVTVRVATSASKPASITVGGARVASSTVTIDPESWATGAAITLTSTGNGEVTGNADVTVSLNFTSGDAAFASLPPVTRSFTILDVDGAGVVPGLAYNTAIIEGTSTMYSVTLQKTPDAEVTVLLSLVKADSTSPFPVPFTVSPSSIVFDAANAKIPQIITVTAGQDNVAYPADVKFHVRHSIKAVTSGGDARYQVLAPLDVPITIADDDVPAVILQPTSMSLVTQASSALTVTIGTRPVTNVTIHLAGSSGITLSTDSVTLTPATWMTGAQVTVTKVNEVHGAMTVTVTASTGGVGSGDYVAFARTTTQATVELPEILPSPTPTATATATGTATATASASSGADVPTATATASASPAAVVPSASAKASASATASVTATPAASKTGASSPTPSPSALPKPEVAVALTVANVRIASFANESTVLTVAASIAQAAGLKPSQVIIKRAVDATTNVVLYLNASFASGPRRLSLGATRGLQALGSVRLEAVLLTATAAEATVLGKSIADNVATFGSSVLTSLKVADSATYGSATVAVERPIFFTAEGASKARPTGVSSGLVAGLIVTVLLVVAGAGAAILYKRRAAAAAGEKELTDLAASAGKAAPTFSYSLDAGLDAPNPMARRRPSATDAASSRAMTRPVMVAQGLPGRAVVGKHKKQPISTDDGGIGMLV